MNERRQNVSPLPPGLAVLGDVFRDRESRQVVDCDEEENSGRDEDREGVVWRRDVRDAAHVRRDERHFVTGQSVGNDFAWTHLDADFWNPEKNEITVWELFFLQKCGPKTDQSFRV